MKKTFACSLVLLTFLLAINAATHSCASGKVENWTEVVTFTGSGSPPIQNTSSFTVTHPEWRIRWQYTPDPNYNDQAFFVTIYPQGETSNDLGTISAFGKSQTNGTVYIENVTGTFYFNVVIGEGVLGYTLTVEENSSSVPEFPSSAVLLFTLIATLLVTIALAHHARRSTKSESEWVTQAASE